MQKYEIIRVGDLIEKMGESSYHQLVADFSCPLNNDLEHFLKNTAVENQKKNISKTNLVYATLEEQKVLVGYYSLAIQVLAFKFDPDIKSDFALKDELSKSMRQKITGFKDTQKTNTPVFLIGQLGKNFYNGYNTLISGEDLFAEAIKDIKEAQKLVAGRLIVVECKDDEHLKNFYGKTLGFKEMECDKANNLLTYAAKISNFKIGNASV